MAVTFCGHGDFYGDEDVKRWLRETVEALILRGADEFLLGGYGGFDACAATVVWELKKIPDDPLYAGFTLSGPGGGYLQIRRHHLPAVRNRTETICHIQAKRVDGPRGRHRGGLCHPRLGRRGQDAGLCDTKKERNQKL